MTNKCTSIAGHFDGHVEALKQYMRHCPMQHVQGYTGSHWMLPSGNYSLRIAPAAARATANKTTMQNAPTLLAVLMATMMRQYNNERMAQWRSFMAFIKATKRCHQVSTRFDITNRTCQCWSFLTFYREKGLKLTCWPLITTGVCHTKLMRRT
jgi:hypothetical protein